eukprot:GFYU01003754.1.p1 GENE.GFYU01003754.1~~GFYU01003754.1.p1  ORF type:complete len:598 (-),score=99.62 GFYU01003754.1:223-2016(-)
MHAPSTSAALPYSAVMSAHPLWIYKLRWRSFKYDAIGMHWTRRSVGLPLRRKRLPKEGMEPKRRRRKRRIRTKIRAEEDLVAIKEGLPTRAAPLTSNTPSHTHTHTQTETDTRHVTVLRRTHTSLSARMYIPLPHALPGADLGRLMDKIPSLPSLDEFQMMKSIDFKFGMEGAYSSYSSAVNGVVGDGFSDIQIEDVKSSPTVMLTALVMVYLAYYFTYCVSEPLLQYDKNQPRTQSIVSQCLTLLKPYYPSFWVVNRHQHSFLFATWPGPRLHEMFGHRYHRDIVRTEDGGVVALDWDAKAPPVHSAKGVVLVLPGLCGETENPYVVKLLHKARSHGYIGCSKSWRGIGVQLETARPETWDEMSIRDLHRVIKHIREGGGGVLDQGVGPVMPIHIVGFSYGGCTVAGYLGSRLYHEDEVGVASGTTLCSLIDWRLMNKHLEEHLFLPYDRVNVSNLKRLMDKNAKTLDGRIEGFSYERWCNTKTAREYNTELTIRLTGDASVPHYGKRLTKLLMHGLENTSVPMLHLVAEDDPLVPEGLARAPKRAARKNSQNIVATLPCGGHCGFLGGDSILKNTVGDSWLNNVVLEFAESVQTQ